MHQKFWTLALSLYYQNLPQPWILMCEKSQKSFVIPYSTYHIINHTELCECSLMVHMTIR